MQEELDADLRQRSKNKNLSNNLTEIELEGIRWLQNKIEEEEIAVVEADKGGAIIITTPQLLRKKTLEKLKDEDLYEKISTDPTKDLHKELVNL